MASMKLSEITRRDLQELEIPASATITDVKHLSSYNWIEAPSNTPTIAVPGIPALWSPPTASQRLKKDSGLIYIAQNAARHPGSPLEPLFRALYITNPSFDIGSIDVVTDRNNIRKLLSFIDPSSTRNGLEAFTMNIEVTKNTALFCRDEAKTTEYIEPHEFRGFGHEFEKAYTVNQVNGSTGHHRIISYRFSDLTFVVRYEADGYIDEIMRASPSQARHGTQGDISSILGALSLSPNDKSSGIPLAGSKMKIEKEGKVVPLELILEIKTRVSHRPLEIQEISTQLWVSQTPKLVRAYHQKGTFQRPEVEDVTDIIKGWEERKQDELRILAALIQKIIIAVKEVGGNFTLNYDVDGDKLVINKVERQEMLPKDLYSKWNNVDHSETENDSQKDDKQGLRDVQPRTDQDSPRASSIIVQYLLEKSVEFQQLSELRQKVSRICAATQPDIQIEDTNIIRDGATQMAIDTSKSSARLPTMLRRRCHEFSIK